MLASCYVEGPITLEKHFIEVDYNAQEVILKADEEILNFTYVSTESDADSIKQEYSSQTARIIENDWFKLILNRNNPYCVCVSLKENLSDKDRKLTVKVMRTIRNDYALIVQKREPVPRK
ncbi:MAG TPA: hypothetical protein DD383_00465 [Rikenellaceae bacterium]|nr:hypothetical protein [Rikenellaceae bacterium]